MAPISNHVSISITVDSVGLTRAGFGTQLVLSNTASFAERLRRYSSTAEVLVDFPDATSAENRAATAAFSQNPKPEQIAIGRAALPATMIQSISVAAVRNTHVYTVTVTGEGVTPTTATYTSDATATDSEIVTGLRDALNAVTGKNFTAVGTASPLVVTGTAAGDWFSLEITDVTDLSLIHTTADPGIATDLAAIALYDNDWYGLVTLYNSNACVAVAEAWAETNKKVYIADTNDTASITAATGGGDTIDDIFTAARARTSGWYHHAPNEMLAAALLGKCLPFTPGSETWKFKTLSGVTVAAMTSTQRSNLTGKRGNGYETMGSVNITFNGQMGDGQFIDTRRFIDWLDDDMGKSVAEALAGASKIPYTDKGIALIENKMRGSLRRGVQSGGLAAEPEPDVTVPKAASVSVANKAARILPDMKFSATLAGAIHSVTVTGTVSV